MGPLEASLPWSNQGLEGARRFLDRVYRLVTESPYKERFVDFNDHELDYAYHFLVKKVTQDFETLQLNTAISQMMIFINDVYKAKTIYRPYFLGFVQMFACIAPHLGEEIWHILNQTQPLTYATWPKYEETMLIKNTTDIAISVLGKFKCTVSIPTGLDDNGLLELVKKEPQVEKLLQGKTITKTIIVKDKLINFIIQAA
jgi:leucyl-tRNA synthetase